MLAFTGLDREGFPQEHRSPHLPEQAQRANNGSFSQASHTESSNHTATHSRLKAPFSKSQLSLALSLQKSKPLETSAKGDFALEIRKPLLTIPRLLRSTPKIHPFYQI